jgi:hypothetical protein
MGNQSVHLNKNAFVSLFGTEEQLLKEVNIKLNELERNDIFYGQGDN